MEPQATEIPLSTPLARLDGHVLLEVEGRYVVLQRQRGHLQWYGLGPHDDREGTCGASPGRSIADLAGLVLHQEVKRAFLLPKGRTETVRAWHPRRRRVWSLVAAPVAVVVGWLGAPRLIDALGVLGWGILILISFTFLSILWTGLIRTTRLTYRTSWRRWELGDLAASGEQNDLAERQVLAVKEAYGRLRTDLTYRVEHPALFDTECPDTEPFNLALVEWDTTQRHLTLADRWALASRVVTTFQQARHHAEQVGMKHLPRPQRRVVRRAAKALRIASDPYATPTERDTALRRATELLDGLVLHYLPSGPEIRQHIGTQHRRELPGRRSR